MDQHEKKVRALKVGDIVCWRNDGDNEVIEEIIFDDIENDMRAANGGRVTINKCHWNIEDVTIVK